VFWKLIPCCFFFFFFRCWPKWRENGSESRVVLEDWNEVAMAFKNVGICYEGWRWRVEAMEEPNVMREFEYICVSCHNVEKLAMWVLERMKMLYVCLWSFGVGERWLSWSGVCMGLEKNEECEYVKNKFYLIQEENLWRWTVKVDNLWRWKMWWKG